ncbi:flagellar hook assembly protein FlgD [Alkalicoccus luteus]|uniref:Flagellar hook assembly protein FlgD n=1 Tax=Alkalicoccus luteus TaxID=1237094 RepID=A0A969PRS1_9BACI|nr:flagellar hook assembly protein FlgD [Alkalicoccus luteus]NJP36349.1 flagellar hook assembly protein FlgD [Alkalicoccus luteus]
MLQSAGTSPHPVFYEDLVKQKQNQAPQQDLDRDAFMKILMTQLQNQDPMNPMEDKEFIAQMAQFSTLEQMTNLNETMRKMFESQQQNGFVSHSDLIGREVTYEAKDEEGNKTDKTGTVDSVLFKDGRAMLAVGDEKIPTLSLRSVNQL